MRVVLVLALGLAATANATDLFSPGDLSKPHAELSGLSNCTKCHPAGAQLSQAQCLSCHAELQPSIKAGDGLHGRISSDKRNCESCHHEHQGVELDLMGWGPGGKKSFDHHRTGWDLKGEHKKTDCFGCHERRLITSPVAIKLLQHRKTMLGLETPCTSCHFDEHRGQEHDDCETCHDEVKWKAAPKFKHADTKYPLKGKHVKVPCEKCHPSETDTERHTFPIPKHDTFLKLNELEFGSCLDCHKDPHVGRFGQNCTSCHTVEGWFIIRNASKEREFHKKTKFPLEGAHLDVDCKACHGPFPGQPPKFKNMAFEQCTDCHADAHVGQLNIDNKPPDCAVCHTLDAFLPPKFGLAAHQKSRFTLEGAHRAVPCNQCHVTSDALTFRIPAKVTAELTRRRRKVLFSSTLLHFQTPTDTCEACHDDVHEKQFSQPNGCQTCHVPASFTTLKFDHARDSRYPLTGKHAKTECEKCHYVGPTSPKRADSKPVIRYRPMEQACGSCHEDAHAGQFTKPPATRAACETCHDTQEFKQTKFNHEPPFTTFVLDGEHAKVKCDQCHAKVSAGGKQIVRYKPVPTTCEGCHADFHKGAFQGFEP